MTSSPYSPFRLAPAPFNPNLACLVALLACCVAGASLGGHNTPDAKLPIRHITLEEMQFADKSLEGKVRRLHAAAKKLARPEWIHKPFESFSDPRARGVYVADWYTFAAADGRFPPANYHGPKELNCYSIGVCFDADKKAPASHLQIVGTSLDALWKPKSEGWSAHMSYRTFLGKASPRSGKPAEQFECWFSNYRTAGSTKPRLHAIQFQAQGSVGVSKLFVFGANEKPFPTRYAVALSTKTWEELVQQPPDNEIIRILASAESLRDYIVESALST